MSKSKAKKKNQPEYMLCFHDFSDDKCKDVFIRLKSTCGDRKNDIFRFFNKDANGTKFIRQMFNIDAGHWRLIHIESAKSIPLVEYGLAKSNLKSNAEV